MVFPLYDDNSDRVRTPFVNYVLIIINCLVFIGPQAMGAEDNPFTYAWSTVPKEIVTGQDSTDRIEFQDPRTKETIARIDLQPTPISVYLTLLTSMFMHGGWAHLLGNMLFLWIFGDNVEDFLGHVRYVFFYLTCGILASLAHVAVTYAFATSPSDLLIPSLGASGAISGVLGAYLLLYPHKQIMVLLGRFITAMPALGVIGLWFVFQVINGLGALGGASGGGIAYGAHIGGFLAGMALIFIFGAGLNRPGYRRSPRAGYW